MKKPLTLYSIGRYNRSKSTNRGLPMTRNERLKEMYNDLSNPMVRRLVALLMSEGTDIHTVTLILNSLATMEYSKINNLLDAYEQEGLAK